MTRRFNILTRTWEFKDGSGKVTEEQRQDIELLQFKAKTIGANGYECLREADRILKRIEENK